MPTLPPKPCRRPGCPGLCRDGSGYCEKHKGYADKIKRRHNREADRKRGTAARRGYGHAWRNARAAYLRKHPLCVECQRNGLAVPATVVDHIKPHRGDMKIFWDRDNWQPLCKHCHDRKTASEDGGFGK